VEAAFLAGLAVRMLGRVAEKGKAVGLGEGFHLRNHHRPGAQAAEAGEIGVVDDAEFRDVRPVEECPVEEALHAEAVKDPVELEIPAFGVAQVEETGLEFGRHATQGDLVGAGVVLHFGPRFVRHPLATGGGWEAEPELAHPARKGGVGDLQPVFFAELFVHALEVAVALLVELAQEVRVEGGGQGLGGTLDSPHRCPRRRRARRGAGVGEHNEGA